MEIVANGRVDHTHGLTAKWKDVIDYYLSKVEGTALEKLLLTTWVTLVETPFVDHVRFRVDMELDDIVEGGHSHLFPSVG